MKLFIVSLFIFSFSAFSAIDFEAQMNDVTCRVSSGKVVRTQAFGKEASLTETKMVSISGIENLVKKAIETNHTTSADPEFTYSMTVDGKKYLLNTDDSAETQNLIRMITKMCR